MKYLYTIPLCALALSCNLIAPQQQEQTTVVPDTIAPNISVDAVATSTLATPFIVPSATDTVKYQLGGKLYFLHVDSISPTDSITVIATRHHNSDEYGNYRQYAFIVHNKKSVFHKHFTYNALSNSYKSWVETESELGKIYGKENKERYNKDIAEQKKAVGKINLRPTINDYIGHWIYLKKYEGQFYINHDWVWLPSFHISEDVITHHAMDGLYPTVIQSFKKEKNGDLLIKTVGSDEGDRYELVDEDLSIYTINGDYVVPAKNAHHFEIIEHANNTGDLLVGSI